MAEETEPVTPKPKARGISAGDVVAVLFGSLALVYLLNPTLGVFELIPDNTPLIGNLDEAAATVILLAALGHFGINIPQALTGRKSEDEIESESPFANPPPGSNEP